MSSRRFTGSGTAAVVSAMGVQTNLTQLLRESCVSGACVNGDRMAERH